MGCAGSTEDHAQSERSKHKQHQQQGSTTSGSQPGKANSSTSSGGLQMFAPLGPRFSPTAQEETQKSDSSKEKHNNSSASASGSGGAGFGYGYYERQRRESCRDEVARLREQRRKFIRAAKALRLQVDREELEERLGQTGSNDTNVYASESTNASGYRSGDPITTNNGNGNGTNKISSSSSSFLVCVEHPQKENRPVLNPLIPLKSDSGLGDDATAAPSSSTKDSTSETNSASRHTRSHSHSHSQRLNQLRDATGSQPTHHESVADSSVDSSASFVGVHASIVDLILQGHEKSYSHSQSHSHSHGHSHGGSQAQPLADGNHSGGGTRTTRTRGSVLQILHMLESTSTSEGTHSSATSASVASALFAGGDNSHVAFTSRAMASDSVNGGGGGAGGQQQQGAAAAATTTGSHSLALTTTATNPIFMSLFNDNTAFTADACLLYTGGLTYCDVYICNDDEREQKILMELEEGPNGGAWVWRESFKHLPQPMKRIPVLAELEVRERNFGKDSYPRIVTNFFNEMRKTMARVESSLVHKDYEDVCRCSFNLIEFARGLGFKRLAAVFFEIQTTAATMCHLNRDPSVAHDTSSMYSCFLRHKYSNDPQDPFYRVRFGDTNSIEMDGTIGGNTLAPTSINNNVVTVATAAAAEAAAARAQLEQSDPEEVARIEAGKREFREMIWRDLERMLMYSFCVALEKMEEARREAEKVGLLHVSVVW